MTHRLFQPTPRAARCALVALCTALTFSVLTLEPNDSIARPAPAPKAPVVDVKGIAEQLSSPDADKVSVALLALKPVARDAVVLAPLVERLLTRGMPNDPAKNAIEILADMGQASSTNALKSYCTHRHVELRRSAVNAVRRTKGPAAVAVLRTALGDSDSRVRSAAASGLGSLAAVEAIDDLFLALDRKVYEAASAIGQLCVGASCDRFVKLAGKLPLPVLTSGADQLFFRPATEMSDDVKVRYVGELRELGTQEIHKYFTDVLGRWPAQGSPRVKVALEQAVEATRLSPGNTPATKEAP